MTVQDSTIDEHEARPVSAERLDRTAAALRGNGFAVHIVDSMPEARRLLGELLPRDQSVFTASSETLRAAGITADIDESGEYQSVRSRAGDLGNDMEARIRLGATPDVVVGSVHAVTEDGRMIVVSATGSQIAPYASGARKAIWVVGAQKVVPDLDSGLRRVRSYTLPREAQRLAKRGYESFIGKILILERESLPGRGTVVLVRERAGY